MEKSQQETDKLLIETRNAAHSRIAEARELAFERHELADELSSLAKSLQEAEDGGSTLFQDIDGLHRNLKELESVKGYVNVIHHALSLRCAQDSLLMCSALTCSTSEKASAQIQSLVASPQYQLSQTSLSDFITLQAFAEKVESTTGARLKEADLNSDLHLGRFLRDLVEKTWDDIKAIMFKYALECIRILSVLTAILQCSP